MNSPQHGRRNKPIVTLRRTCKKILAHGRKNCRLSPLGRQYHRRYRLTYGSQIHPGYSPKKIEGALTKEGVDSQRAHELAQAYRELELGKAHLREDAQRYLLSTGRGILEGLFSRKGTTTTAADFVPVIPLGPIVYTLGDIVGAARAIREINEAKAGQHSIQEGTLKLLAALIPYVPTGLAQQTLERVFEAMYVSHVLDTNPKDE